MRERKAIIWETSDTTADRIRLGEDDGTVIVPVSESSGAVEVARELVEDGARSVELCGSFGPLWHAKVTGQVGDEASVGAIAYGFESITSVADYKSRFEAGENLKEAFIVLQNGADPAQDRIVREHRNSKTTFAAVPTADEAARVARELADEGVGLIEVYGGFGPEATAQVIEAVEARVPVGFVSYPQRGARDK